MSESTNQKILLTYEQAKELESTAASEGYDFYGLYITQRLRYNMSHSEALIALPKGVDGYQLQRLKQSNCDIYTLGELDDALYEIGSAGEDYANRVNLFVYLVCNAGFSAQESIKRAATPEVLDESYWSKCTA